MRFTCFKCEDEVTIPKGTEFMAAKVRIVCDECVDDLKGTRFGTFFEETQDDEDGEEADLPDNGSKGTL